MTTIVTRAGKGSPLTHTEVDTNFTNLNTNKLETAAIPLGTLAAPSISFVGDANTGAYSPGADTLAFVTAGSNRVHITSGGLVGIGNTSPTFAAGGGVQASFATFSSFRATSGSNTGTDFATASDGKGYIYVRDNADLLIGTNNAERARIDSSGRLLIGTSTTRSDLVGLSPRLQVEGTDQGTSTLSITRNSENSGGPALLLAKSRGAAAGAVTVVQNNDNLGGVYFMGADGTNVEVGAQIVGEVDGTPGANDMPGRLVFSTTADGASSPTEKMRISSTGAAFFKKTVNDYTTEGAIINQGAGAGSDTSFVTTGGTAATFARSTNDGTIISLRQDGTEEGTISVSGTTVSYNGAHLSRWSQLPSGAERIEIFRGSVLSNLDEMCEWGEEENEQLNRMKVSDVEGDKNVSGVFQCWDDDDDTYTNDFYCAMTGDFTIRIADGVTVERGDLLMSAGDGTAKPQEDDIIRSKTIAKVTSTNVSCTYEDGSYCVPCVLMAC